MGFGGGAFEQPIRTTANKAGKTFIGDYQYRAFAAIKPDSSFPGPTHECRESTMPPIQAGTMKDVNEAPGFMRGNC